MSCLLRHPRSKDGRKDRDEGLLLFQELHRRANISLLQPVSDEFEPNYAGSNPIYRIGSAKKSSENEFLAENEKNDYDWLKTPPATPMFPSLEMEPNAAGAVVHRELPIFQPLSRFAGNSKDTNRTIPPTKPKVPPRSVTPSQRPGSSQAGFRSNRSVPALGGSTQLKIEQSKRTDSAPSYNKVSVSVIPKSINTDSNSKAKPRSRGVSPLVRSTIPSQFPGFSDETPPNLRKDRPVSASRGRPAISSKPVMESGIVNPRRQSCSPSVTRGRKEPTRASEVGISSSSLASSQKAKSAHTGGNGSLVLGSRMVEKMMNARKSGIRPKTPPSSDASSLRWMSKHTVPMQDARRDQTTSTHHLGAMASRSNPRSSLTK